MNHKNFILILFFILNAIFGQVNTERFRTPDDQVGFTGYIELNGDIKTGNTDKIELGFDGRLDYKTTNTRSFIIIQEDYEWIGGSRSSEKGLIHARYVRDFADSLEIEIFGQINYNKKILVKNRELAGAGLRYKIFELNQSDLHIGTAYMFEHENYDLEADASHPDEQSVGRWSNYLTYYNKVNEKISLSFVVYYQPAFNDFADYRLLNENHIRVGLSKKFSLTLNFKLRYDSKPPERVKAADTETRIGVAFSF